MLLLKQQIIAYILILNSNNIRPQKYFANSEATESDNYPRTIEMIVALLSTFKVDTSKRNGGKAIRNSQNEVTAISSFHSAEIQNLDLNASYFDNKIEEEEEEEKEED